MKTQDARTKLFALMIALVAAASSAEAVAAPGMKVVDCGAGKTIAEALSKAEAGDTIIVSGTCRERVTITTDRITLDGQRAAILDGGGGAPTEFDGVVTIDGASGVVIKGFTIQRGPGEGILGMRGAAFAVHNTVVQDNAATGIAVGDSSSAELIGCTMRRNGFGLDVFTGSSAVLKNAIDITNNVGNGIEVNGQSTLEIRGAAVQLSNNGAFGLIAGSGQVAIFGFGTSQGSSITAHHNGAGGIVIASSIFTVFARSTISASNNPTGIFVVDGTLVSPVGNSTFLIENNAIGLNFGQGSGALVVGGLTVRNNSDTGVLADAADSLTFVSIPANPSAITRNGTDVDLGFGTRVTFDGVAIGTIKCDKTVLSRGTTVCP